MYVLLKDVANVDVEISMKLDSELAVARCHGNSISTSCSTILAKILPWACQERSPLPGHLWFELHKFQVDVEARALWVSSCANFEDSFQNLLLEPEIYMASLPAPLSWIKKNLGQCHGDGKCQFIRP